MYDLHDSQACKQESVIPKSAAETKMDIYEIKESFYGKIQKKSMEQRNYSSMFFFS